jgi:hypothetical protein
MLVGSSLFVAIRNCLALWFEAVRAISNFGCVAITLFFARVFEGWGKPGGEHRAVVITPTIRLYHVSTRDAREIESGEAS